LFEGKVTNTIMDPLVKTKNRIVGNFEGEAVFDERDSYVDIISSISSEGILQLHKLKSQKTIREQR